LQNWLEQFQITPDAAAPRAFPCVFACAGWIGADEAASLLGVPNIRQQGTRLGNWLTRAHSCYDHDIFHTNLDIDTSSIDSN
jgi:hypothetical protein